MNYQATLLIWLLIQLSPFLAPEVDRQEKPGKSSALKKFTPPPVLRAPPPNTEEGRHH